MRTTPLEQIAEVIRGITFSKTDGTSRPQEGRLPVIRAGSIQQRLLLDKDQIWIPSDKIKPHQIIRKNDIVMCTSSGSSDLVGKCAKSEQDWNGSFGAFCAGIRADNSKCDSSYLYHFLCSPQFRNWSKASEGVNIKNIRASELAAFEIPLPPLIEQKRIAAILDKADSLRRKSQQAIQLGDQFLRAVFLDMFGDPVTNTKGWEIKHLKDQIAHANNGLSRRRKETENEGEIVLRLQDVHYDGIQFEKDLNRIKLDEKEASRYKVDIGDILFIRVNGNPDYVGRSAVFKGYSEPVFHNDHLIRIKVSDAYNSEFLSYCFNYKGSRKIISTQIKTSAGQYTISQEGIERLEFFRPPIELQNKFIVLKNHILNIPHRRIDVNVLFNSLSQKAFAGEL